MIRSYRIMPLAGGIQSCEPTSLSPPTLPNRGSNLIVAPWHPHPPHLPEIPRGSHGMCPFPLRRARGQL